MARATEAGARELRDRLDAALAEYNSVDRGYLLSYSAGIATLKPHQSLKELISEADKLMYIDKSRQKHGGRSCSLSERQRLGEIAGRLTIA